MTHNDRDFDEQMVTVRLHDDQFVDVYLCRDSCDPNAPGRRVAGLTVVNSPLVFSLQDLTHEALTSLADFLRDYAGRMKGGALKQ